MRRKGYLGTSSKSFCNLATFSVDFLHFICWMSFDSPTPISLQSAKFRRFGDVFHRLLHFVSWKFAVFLLPVFILPTAPSSKLICPSTAELLCSCCCYVAWPCDLDFWPYDLDQVLYMAGHVVNIAKKLEDPMPIRSWIMSYNVFHWLLLKIRFRLLRMRRMKWPVRWG